MAVDHHSPAEPPPEPAGAYVPLFWRLFLPNAAVLAAASALLVLDPPNGRVTTILGGFLILVAVNLVLMRHAFAPLTRLTELARRVDPLRPGERLPLQGPNSETRLLTEGFNDMLERIERERRESARRALAAEQEQRRSIARELHDELGQDLTGIRLQLPGGEVRDQLDGALASLRRIAAQLRPEALDDLGLAAALTAHCERVAQRTGLDVELAVSRELPPLSLEGELVLFRVAQESVTNVVRHARARSARITLVEEDGGVVLTVTDDGRGLAAGEGAGGQGIRGMRERAVLIGAQLTTRALPAGGTEVRLAVPVETL